MQTPLPRLSCFFDCDNTLLDNDALKADVDARLRSAFGETLTGRFWEIYEEERHEMGTVDFPATLARLRKEDGDAVADVAHAIIWDYPFSDRVYPGSLAALAHIRALGGIDGIVSDGDDTYQPHKILLSGLSSAVEGRVKVYLHKTAHIDEICDWLPAQHYVMVDDKAPILAEIKRRYPQRFTTIHVRQGHYSGEQAQPAADITLNHIGDLIHLGIDQLLGMA
jgi:FMN phosphatase YigB (HAD superfamily)